MKIAIDISDDAVAGIQAELDDLTAHNKPAPATIEAWVVAQVADAVTPREAKHRASLAAQVGSKFVSLAADDRLAVAEFVDQKLAAKAQTGGDLGTLGAP